MCYGEKWIDNVICVCIVCMDDFVILIIMLLIVYGWFCI